MTCWIFFFLHIKYRPMLLPLPSHSSESPSEGGTKGMEDCEENCTLNPIPASPQDFPASREEEVSQLMALPSQPYLTSRHPSCSLVLPLFTHIFRLSPFPLPSWTSRGSPMKLPLPSPSLPFWLTCRSASHFVVGRGNKGSQEPHWKLQPCPSFFQRAHLPFDGVAQPTLPCQQASMLLPRSSLTGHCH